MTIELPALAYANDALEPYRSAETLDFRYGKHHRAYVDNLNKLIAGTEFESMILDDIVKKNDGVLAIENTGNADTPILRGDKPLLTCDVREHAYYIDYHNARAEYLETFWKIADWEFMTQKLYS